MINAIENAIIDAKISSLKDVIEEVEKMIALWEGLKK